VSPMSRDMCRLCPETAQSSAAMKLNAWGSASPGIEMLRQTRLESLHPGAAIIKGSAHITATVYAIDE
jgi:hypothetical protein